MLSRNVTCFKSEGIENENKKKIFLKTKVGQHFGVCEGVQSRERTWENQNPKQAKFIKLKGELRTN
ncbi:hypothetical protein HanPI659440_Chr09g0327871 [Helianthus annuus]|nr:hypothetical protein HanPI659440_Chr09g0327871 [Helianthus annuus]